MPGYGKYHAVSQSALLSKSDLDLNRLLGKNWVKSKPVLNGLAQNMTSLTLGHSGDEKSVGFCEIHRHDVNHDKGQLLDATPIHGSESIRIAH